MNFDSDINKLPTGISASSNYPISGIGELIEELPVPHTGQGSHHFDAASKILNTPDAALVSQLVDAFATTPTDQMNLSSHDAKGLESVGTAPLLQAVYNNRNIIQPGLNPSLSHVGMFGSLPINPNTCGSESVPRVPSLYPGGVSRAPVSRPVQAVAPQPRHPQQTEKVQLMDGVQPIHEQKHSHPPSATNVISASQEENPKICLKIRRTKKGHRNKEKHSSRHSTEYGIVPSDSKPEGAGPIKLKLARVKQPSLTDGGKVHSEQAFKVSSLIMPECSHDLGQKEAEEAASAMVREVFKDKSPVTPTGDQFFIPKTKISKTEKRSKHKLHQHNATAYLLDSFSNSSGTEYPTSLYLSGQSHATSMVSSHSNAHHNSMHFATESAHMLSHATPSPSFGNSYSYVGQGSTIQGPAQRQVNHISNQFQSMNSQMKQVVPQQSQYKPTPLVSHYSSAVPHGNPVGNSTFVPNIHSGQPQLLPPFQTSETDTWSGGKQNHSVYIEQNLRPSHMDFVAKPPPYKEAVLSQQRVQNQLYQPIGQQPPVRNIDMQHGAATGMYSQAHHMAQASQQPMQQQVHFPIKQEAGYQTYVTQQHQYHSNYLMDENRHQPAQHRQAQDSQRLYYQNVSFPMKQGDQQQMQGGMHILPTQQQYLDQSQLIMASAQPLPQPQVALQRTDVSFNAQKFQQPHNQQSGQMKHSTTSGMSVNYMNTPSSNMMTTSAMHHTAAAKTKKKGNKNQGGAHHVRVKFIADAEETDIYKLKDILYPDDTPVSSFDELQPDMQVVAKWPMNGKLYKAVVIDPLDNTGRRFRERKPPPKPFQLHQNTARKDRKSFPHGPSLVLDKLDSASLPSNITLSDSFPESSSDGFGAYTSMVDRIKLKKRERLGRDFKLKDGKKRKHGASDSSDRNLITMESDESEEEFTSPARKRSHQDELRKKERRRAIESKHMQTDGSGSCHRLMLMIGNIFDEMDAVDPMVLDDTGNGQKDAKVPQCLLLSRPRLQELSGETAKLKAMGLLHQLPKRVLVRLLTILESNMRDGVNLKPMNTKGNSAEEQKWNRECRLDRVNSSTEAAIAAMNVMTAHYMPKAVYIDDVMDRAAQLLRQQLNNTIYPEYDPVYRGASQNKKGSKELSTASTRMKRAHYKGPKNRAVLQLYNRLNILLGLWEELVIVQPLTDTTILQISSVGISPFFVENIRELQLSAIRLTTGLFSRYDKHRSLILEDIFQSLARLPTSKRNLRSYRLTYAEELVDSSDEEDNSSGRKGGGGLISGDLQHIQMVSALILQMIHAIVNLPLPEADIDLPEKEQKLQHEVDEMKVITSYEMAMRTGQKFLSVFLKKCASRSEEIDYRPLFENMVHDLLATVNKPEWPASEMLLSLLGRLLVHTFSTKSTEMSLRVASLDYLGVVAAKLRRDAITSHTDVNSIQRLLQRLEESASDHLKEQTVEEEKGTGDDLKIPVEADEEKILGKNKGRRKKSGRKRAVKKNKLLKKGKKLNESFESEEEKLTRRLQYLILGYLRRNAHADPSLLFAHNFYIGQWLRDVSLEFQQLQEQGKAEEQFEVLSDRLQACHRKKNALMEMASSAAVAASISLGGADMTEETKTFLKKNNLQKTAEKLAAGLSVEDAALVSRHLASTRPFSRAFDSYLSYILRVREESAVALRTRAIKCLAEVVAVDPSIMERDDIAQGVQASLVDGSTSVREAAIDLVGRFIILKPDLVKHYYTMLTSRILDTGVSVRKRVIKVLRDLCHEHPDLPQLTDACVKMIRRVNDEDGIKKLVHEVFNKMWFTPVDPQNTESLRKKALLITDIVSANKERGYEWIEQLFKNLIDTPTSNPQVERACQQIIDCLVQHVIMFENPDEKQSGNDAEMTDNNSNIMDTSTSKPGLSSTSSIKNKVRSIRLVATIQTMVQLARIRPRLLVPHVMTLQPYLATKYETPDDALTVHGVCRILELAIPLMEHPSEAFLASIEEDMMRMILTPHRFHVVSAAVACLGAVTCRVTFNYRLIRDCFQRMCSGLSIARALHQKNPEAIFQPNHFNRLLRTLFIVGHFCKNFDFDHETIKGKSQVCVKEKVYDCLFYFVNIKSQSPTEELRGFSIAALGLLMVQDPNMMFLQATRELYRTLLEPSQPSDKLKKQVLQNLQNYLQTEDVKMQEAAEASVKKHKQEGDGFLQDDRRKSVTDEAATDEDIKEICDVSSGMASSVMQLFLKQILESLFHRHVTVRHAALHTVYLTLQQGLVHPVQCVPYLIAAASDPEAMVHKEADQQLVDLNKRYHGFIHTKALQGMRLAYHLQSYIYGPSRSNRGYNEVSTTAGEEGTGTKKASCAQLYHLVRSDRKHRRALLLSLLNLFDDTVKTDLGMLIFVADNLAHFPYHTIDEPLFLMSQIEVYVSVSGSNVLQSFREALQKKSSKRAEKEEKRARKLAEREESQLSDSSSSSSSSEDEESDDEEKESLESRLPLRDDALKEFAHLSLACLLLLWLKQHLKTLFGITDNKIRRYSPTEANRANDKQCHRRRPDMKFEPTQAIEHVERVKNGISCRNPEYIAAVVRQYKEFNELMNQLDPSEEDSDSDREKKASTKLSASVLSTSDTAKEALEEESDRDTDGEVAKPAAPLDVIRQSTALKSKKRSSNHKNRSTSVASGLDRHHSPPEMRKRQDIQYLESSSDSDEEFRGF